MESFLAAILGTLIGSFLNVVILRIPEDESIVYPSSQCPICKGAIKWFDNIPVLSFLLLRAKCRHCKTSISWQYPVVEIMMGGLSYFLFQSFGFNLEFLIYFLFCAALLAIIFIDCHHQIIPDVISLPGIALGFAISFINPHLTWQASGLGLLFGGGIFYAIATGYYLIAKRAGMGGGDIKLLAMIGAFLGWQSLPFIIFTSALLGTIIGIGAMVQQKKGGKTVVPYGPFLAVASYIFLFFQTEIEYFIKTYYLVPLQ